jgi:hypothetical protein
MQRTFLRMDSGRILCLLFCAASGFFSYPMYAESTGCRHTGGNQILLSSPSDIRATTGLSLLGGLGR